MPDQTYKIGLDARKLQDFGIGTYVRNLVRALAALDTGGVSLRYTLLVRPEDREQLADLPPHFELAVESAPVYSVRELATLSWRLWRQRLDLYHATHYVLPAVLRSRVVVTIHDIIHLLYPEFLPSRLAFFYARRMIHHSLTRGDRIIAVSQNTRADLMQQFAVDGRKIEVIYNGVEDVFRRHLPEEEIESWLHRLGIVRPYLLFVGNPKPHKNLDTVVQAYARARQLAPFDAPLICVGSRAGSEFKIRQRAEHLGLGDQVRLLGHVAQEALPAIYQGAALFLYPTLYEGFGLPVERRWRRASRWSPPTPRRSRRSRRATRTSSIRSTSRRWPRRSPNAWRTPSTATRWPASACAGRRISAGSRPPGKRSAPTWRCWARRRRRPPPPLPTPPPPTPPATTPR